MSKPIDLTKDTFEEEVINSDIPVFIDFWAPWCGPCLMMSPILDDLASEYDGKIKVTKLNVDLPENRQLAIEYGIQGIPNMKIIYKGKVIQDLVGFRPKDRLLGEVDIVLEKIEDMDPKDSD